MREDNNIYIKDINKMGQLIEKDVCDRLKNVMDMVAVGLSSEYSEKLIVMCDMTYDSFIKISNNLKNIN